jgi:hypothetical protein
MSDDRALIERGAIEALDPVAYAAAIPGLAALVVDAVEGGASVNFLAGVSMAQASDWWSDRTPEIVAGTTTAFVAVEPGGAAAGRGASSGRPS